MRLNRTASPGCGSDKGPAERRIFKSNREDEGKTHFFSLLTLASYEAMPFTSFTALIMSSTLALSGSYLTTASPLSRETWASLTPFTDSSADCTAVTQDPQVIPLTSSVTVASFARGDAAGPAAIANWAKVKTKPKAKALFFISATSGRHYIT